jgi:STE24 endopeptidase
VLEPVFNRFRPLEDAELSGTIHELGERAGTTVRDVLVADASRRTRKENAYVSGLGRTRRVVVYDTLLRRAPHREIGLIVAHELGHRRERHVVWGTLLGAAGAAASVAVLWALLRVQAVLSATHASGPADPRVIPFVLFAVSALELVSMPVGTAISRRWERAADRFGIRVTRDAQGYAEMAKNLGLTNLADLTPSRPVYYLLFTHPSIPERIAAALSAAGSTTA